MALPHSGARGQEGLVVLLVTADAEVLVLAIEAEQERRERWHQYSSDKQGSGGWRGTVGPARSLELSMTPPAGVRRSASKVRARSRKAFGRGGESLRGRAGLLATLPQYLAVVGLTLVDLSKVAWRVSAQKAPGPTPAGGLRAPPDDASPVVCRRGNRLRGRGTGWAAALGLGCALADSRRSWGGRPPSPRCSACFKDTSVNSRSWSFSPASLLFLMYASGVHRLWRLVGRRKFGGGFPPPGGRGCIAASQSWVVGDVGG